tara:strand:- start:240 stop:1835 length:1596 start_codon:yes stop_codon:yes gene_type:complete
MGRYKTNFTGYRSADTWKEQGLIGDTLQFTDDETITALGIGKAMDIVRAGCAMDAALVYTLVSLGPDQHFTAKDMLNERTRKAALYDTQMIADGYYSKEPEDVCGEPLLWNLHCENIYNYYTAPVRKGKLQALVDWVFEDLPARSPVLTALTQPHEYYATTLMGDIDVPAEFLVSTSPDREFKNGYVDMFQKVLQCIPDKVGYQKTTSGYCSHKDESCELHFPSPYIVSGWVCSPELLTWDFKGKRPSRLQLYNNKLCSSYYSNNKHLNQNTSTHRRVIAFTQHERAIMQNVCDKFVIKVINKALNRMVKSGRCRQVTAGRGRTFEWQQWSWLDRVREQVLLSNSMQRKVGDTINGWVYSIKSTNEQYGQKIHTYYWVPKDKVQYQKVLVLMPYLKRDQVYKNGSWVYVYKLGHSNTILPYIFTSEQAAQAYADNINAVGLSTDTGIPIHKELDSDFNAKVALPQAHVTTGAWDIQLKPDVYIEDEQTPQAMFVSILKKPALRKKVKEYSEHMPTPLTMIVKKKEEVEATA